MGEGVISCEDSRTSLRFPYVFVRMFCLFHFFFLRCYQNAQVPKHHAPSKEWLRELLYHEYVKSHDLLYPQCLVLMRLVNCDSDELKLAVKKDENERLLKVLFDEKKSTRLRRAALRLLVTHYEGENFKYVLKYVGHVVKCSKGYSVDLASDMIGLARMYLQRNQNKWNTLLSSEDDMVELGAMAVAGGWSPVLSGRSAGASSAFAGSPKSASRRDRASSPALARDSR